MEGALVVGLSDGVKSIEIRGRDSEAQLKICMVKELLNKCGVPTEEVLKFALPVIPPLNFPHPHDASKF